MVRNLLTKKFLNGLNIINLKLRFARHTNNLITLTKFYTEILGLEMLGKFENHDNYNGIFLGKKGENWHLEFTESNEKANHTFDDDDLLVFYPENKNMFDKIMSNINKSNLEKLKPKNPYWSKNGIAIKDPDGYGIIIAQIKTNK